MHTFAHPSSRNKNVVRRVDPDFFNAGVIEKLLQRPKPQQFVPQILTERLSRTVARRERHLIGYDGGQILPRVDQAVPHPVCQSRSGIGGCGHSPMVSKVAG
jgi:hypothetical protein